MSAGSAGPGRRPRRRRGRRCRRPGRRSRRRRAPPPPRASRTPAGRPCRAGQAGSPGAPLALAGHAEAGGREGLEALVADGLAAALAEAVGAGLHPDEGLLDVLEGVAQAAHEGEEVGAFGGGLAGVGEALVQLRVLDAFGVASGAEVVELAANLAPLGLEPFPQPVSGLLVHPGPPSRFCPPRPPTPRRSTLESRGCRLQDRRPARWAACRGCPGQSLGVVWRARGWARR